MFKFTDRALAEKYLNEISKMGLNVKIMHVCGGHQETLVRSGLDGILRGHGVDVRAGPGCPVCVTPAVEIEEVMHLSSNGISIAVFGDMVRVPGKSGNFLDARSNGADIQMVYSIDDAVLYAKKNPQKDVVFMAIGFETTAPSTAAALSTKLPDNFSVFSTHRYVPPALDAVIKMGDIDIQGLIEPGHVSAIIGVTPYRFLTECHGVPQVISGFEAMDLLVSTYRLCRMIKDGKPELINEYSRVVKEDGNIRARRLLDMVFEAEDSEWRGFGTIPGSGMKIKNEFSKHDAKVRYKDILKGLDRTSITDPPGCSCSEVLRGLIEPTSCPLFGNACNPLSPVGPCMVTAEGSCHIALKYGMHNKT